MVRGIVVLGGNSHPQLVETLCNTLGVQKCNRLLSKFSVGESRLEIQDSVRGKDVYIVQSGGGKVNDNFVDLCIMISACKTGSAKRVTAVLPLFPYSRQPDVPYNKIGAPLSKAPVDLNKGEFTFESRPVTPGGPGLPPGLTLANGMDGLQKKLGKASLEQANGAASTASTASYNPQMSNGVTPRRSDTTESLQSIAANGRGQQSTTTMTSPGYFTSHDHDGLGNNSNTAKNGGHFTTHDYENSGNNPNYSKNIFQAKPGYKQWVAQAGTLVADLLTCAGADHIITMDLHDPQYQGFFDIPVDNLYGQPLLKRYIQQNIQSFQDAVVVSPDAGGAKRATAIADSLNMQFALIHKVMIDPAGSTFAHTHFT